MLFLYNATVTLLARKASLRAVLLALVRTLLSSMKGLSSTPTAFGLGLWRNKTHALFSECPRLVCSFFCVKQLLSTRVATACPQRRNRLLCKRFLNNCIPTFPWTFCLAVPAFIHPYYFLPRFQIPPFTSSGAFENSVFLIGGTQFSATPFPKLYFTRENERGFCLLACFAKSLFGYLPRLFPSVFKSKTYLQQR